MNIDKAFGLILRQEGIAQTLIKGDRGGLTKFGIDAASHPGLDITNLTLEGAQDIYKSEYWDACKCDSLIPELQYAHFSCAVNCGPGTANKILQRACNVPDDGIVGPATLAAATKLDISGYCLDWGLHYNSIIEAAHERNDYSQDQFAKGWHNRLTVILNWFGQGLLS